MAQEEINATGTNEVQTTETHNDTPSIEDLMAQLEAAKADRDRYKTANDKLSKSEADMKRQLRAKQTAEEAEAEAKAEAEREAKEQFEAVTKELNHIKAVSAYKNISSETTVENLIAAIADSDHVAIAAILDNEIKAAVKNAEAEWIKTRPRVNAGNAYSNMSVAEIMAIKDDAKRLEAIALNKEMFKK